MQDQHAGASAQSVEARDSLAVGEGLPAILGTG